MRELLDLLLFDALPPAAKADAPGATSTFEIRKVCFPFWGHRKGVVHKKRGVGHGQEGLATERGERGKNR